MYIEKAKREFVTEITAMNMKVSEIAKLSTKLDQIDKFHQEQQADLLLKVETKLVTQKTAYDRRLEEMQEHIKAQD